MVKFLKLKNRIGKNRKFFLMLKAASLCLLINFIFFYVAQISKSSVSVYEINDLENKIIELRNNNESLKQRVAELKSTVSVNKRIKELNFVAVEEVKYIKTGEAMARAE